MHYVIIIFSFSSTSTALQFDWDNQQSGREQLVSENVKVPYDIQMESDTSSISEKTDLHTVVEPVEDKPASQGIVRVQELWFEDGGIIVQAGSALYRVSRGILAARSSIFKNAFQLCSASPTGEGLEMMDGVPFLRLPDAERDVTHFFKAIFDSSYFEPHPSKTSFSAIVGVLRLSHKYDVEFLRQRALKHLYANYAHGSLGRWNARSKHIAYSTENEFLEAFMVVQIAIEVDVQHLLSAAVYTCCTYPIQRILALGSEPDSADFAVFPTFSSAQMLCLNTWPKIRASYHSLYGHLRTKTCIDWPRCLVYMNDNSTTYSNIASVHDAKNDPLDSLDENYWESLRKNVCKSCFLESRKFYDKWRSDLWLELPWMMDMKGTDDPFRT
ncbi:hypothetical protein APHAL10511_005100 [Amanita phalloides]|nr:hypothetical protein APHAL10511_005100 [Amanita phalloides]